MSKTLIYGAGLIIVVALIVFVLFLTFHNAFSDYAILGDENNTFIVNGYPAIFINLGVFTGVLSLISYLVYLFNRHILFYKLYAYLGLFSSALVTIGLVVNAT